MKVLYTVHVIILLLEIVSKYQAHPLLWSLQHHLPILSCQLSHHSLLMHKCTFSCTCPMYFPCTVCVGCLCQSKPIAHLVVSSAILMYKKLERYNSIVRMFCFVCRLLTHPMLWYRWVGCHGYCLVHCWVSHECVCVCSQWGKFTCTVYIIVINNTLCIGNWTACVMYNIYMYMYNAFLLFCFE